MDKEKNYNTGIDIEGEEGDGRNEPTAPRARNRTVMLTPEITGQVRARLAQDAAHGGAPQSSNPSDQGVLSSGAFYTPTSRASKPVENPGISSVEHRGNTGVAAQGQRLQAPVAPAESREGLVWQKMSPVVGFLVSFDTNINGDIYELRSGRLIITSESAGQGNYLLLRDDSVSPMHAILRIGADGEVQVLDQLSEFGTRIKRFGSEEQKELSGDKGTVEHGDTVSFGKRSFHVCMIAFPPIK